jgi:cytochrome P450
MGIEARKISRWDVLRLQLLVTIPASLWGLVVPNRFFVWLLSRWDAGRCTNRFFLELRRKYACDHLWGWFPSRRTLLVLDPESTDAVLRSGENAADPKLKKEAFSLFVPDALVVSSGDEWSVRRHFNTTVLALGGPHPHEDAFREIVVREVDQLTAGRAGALLRWKDFALLGERISHQIILGSGRVDPEMTAQLARAAWRGNLWPLLWKSRRAFSAFYERMDRYLGAYRAFDQGSRRGREANGEPVPASCLMHQSAKLIEEGKVAPATRVPMQIGFWFYVMKDALELHVARTLALIAAHPEVQERVRAETRKAPESTAQAIRDFGYLDACIREQLRLWTPVPILLRRAVKPFSLRGEIAIQPEQQILMHVGFYHRDPRFFGELADQFSPDRATGAFPPVYFFSHDRQSCAGESLVRFLLKAVLALLLAKFRFELISPGIAPNRVPYLYDHFGIKLRIQPDAPPRLSSRSSEP